MLWLILKIIIGVILVVVSGGAGLFGYIAWKAKAKTWSVGMFAIVAVCVFLFYWFVLNNPWGLIPF